MPEQFKIPDAPKTARRVSCFAYFKKDSTMLDVVRKCGIPDKHAGSGNYIFVYYMNDCSTVTVDTPDLKRIGISHVKNGKTTVILCFSGSCTPPNGGAANPKLLPATSNEVSSATIEKQITVHGKVQLGKVGWYVLLDNQQEIYFFPGRSSEWKSYDEMRGEFVTATGILRFFQCPKNPLTDKEGRVVNKQGRVIDRCSDYFYFQADTAQVRLIGP